MPLYIGEIVINVPNVKRSAEFWKAALGFVERDEESDDEFVVLTDPQKRWANIGLQRLEVPKTGRSRLHLDLYTSEQDQEVARLETLGATRLPWDYPPDADYVVMSDPDGNEFCVVQSKLEQEAAQAASPLGA